MKCRRDQCPAKAVRTTHGLCQRHRDVETRKLGLFKVPAAPVVEHVVRLREAGMGWNRIADLAEVSSFTVRGIFDHGNTKIQAKNARAILSVPLPDQRLSTLSAGSKVPIVGTRRRVQALIALGYTNRQIAAAIDYPPSQMYGLIHGNELTTVGTARRVQDAFDRLQMLPPPETTAAKRSRLRAQRHGWAPPFAWDEDEIDNPEAKPHMIPSVERDWVRKWPERFREYSALGMGVKDMARAEGVSEMAIYKRLERLKNAA